MNRDIRQLSGFALSVIPCVILVILSVVIYDDRTIAAALVMLVLSLLSLVVHILTDNHRFISALLCFVTVPVFILMFLLKIAGISSLMIMLFIPEFLLFNCGWITSLVASTCLMVFSLLMFYTPVGASYISGFPVEVNNIYPVIFLISAVITVSMGYIYDKSSKNLSGSYEKLLDNSREREDYTISMMRQSILCIVNAVDAKDSYTRNHSLRVARYSAKLAELCGWDHDKVEELYQMALLHDIGKIGIDDAILKKHDKLTPDERSIIEKHTVIGAEILKDFAVLPRASIGALGHHERYDGKGYPDGVKGTRIPIEARIIAVADSFDAMNSSRVYRKKMNADDIIRELENGAGTQYDPDLVKIFIPIAKDVLRYENIAE
ncbi:MAG: HD-GYP domain-containing protein [Eubacteriales bacterium]|nr:HD-GYP domain-containing protein [Eubacteriales bacterium]